MRHFGGSVTLTTGFAPIENPGRGLFHLNLRNAPTGGTVWLSHNGTTTSGYLQAGEAKTYRQLSTGAVYVKGPAGQLLYWDGEGQ